MSKKLGMTIGVAMLAMGSLMAVPAQAVGVKVGVLTCNVDSGWGYILGSSKDLRCNYVPNNGFGEHYYGNIAKVGVDKGLATNPLLGTGLGCSFSTSRRPDSPRQSQRRWRKCSWTSPRGRKRRWSSSSTTSPWSAASLTSLCACTSGR